jgi:hypothetical protein
MVTLFSKYTRAMTFHNLYNFYITSVRRISS